MRKIFDRRYRPYKSPRSHHISPAKTPQITIENRPVLRVSDFNFDLPEELIAQSPPAIRGSSRMLVLDRATRTHHDIFFRNLPEILKPHHLLLLNDIRVIPPRLYATRPRLHT